MSGPTRPDHKPRAIVTGGAGFVGSHLVDRLIAAGQVVLVVDDLSTGREDRLAPGAAFVELDISTADLDPVFARWAPDVVYHLAAQASVPLSERDPERDLTVNVIGTHRVAVAARAARARRLVFASSGGAIYGESRRPATERALPAPASYYGVHKLAAEGHIKLAGLPFAIVRPSNIYGPHQAPGLEGAVVAAFLDQGAQHGRLVIHGDGRQTRDFVHVTDVIAAIQMLGDTEGPSGTWNLATGQQTSIVELADLVEVALGRSLARTERPSRAGDVRHSAISSRALNRSGWEPVVTLTAGITDLARNSSRTPG